MIEVTYTYADGSRQVSPGGYHPIRMHGLRPSGVDIRGTVSNSFIMDQLHAVNPMEYQLVHNGKLISERTIDSD